MVLDFQTETPFAPSLALAALADWTVEAEFAKGDYPSDCVVLGASTDGLTICESDESGYPVEGATWLVPWDEVRRITVI